MPWRRNFLPKNCSGDQNLDDGALRITVNDDGLHAWGKGHCLGGLADIDVTRPVGATISKAVIGITMADAARAKRGLAVLPGLSGPGGMHITAPLGATGPLKAQIDVDLSKAEIDGLGITKPAGRPGKLGGLLRNLYRTLEGDDVREYLKEKIKHVLSHEYIKVYTDVEVKKTEGFVGNFETTLTNGDVIRHGAIILATGGIEYQPTEYLYHESDHVITTERTKKGWTPEKILNPVIVMS